MQAEDAVGDPAQTASAAVAQGALVEAAGQREDAGHHHEQPDHAVDQVLEQRLTGGGGDEQGRAREGGGGHQHQTDDQRPAAARLPGEGDQALGPPGHPARVQDLREGEQDPCGEPAEVGRQPLQRVAQRELTRAPGPVEVPPHADAHHGREPDEHSAGAEDPATAHQQHHQRGQQEVEADLDRQAPHLGQPGRRARGGEGVEHQQADQPVGRAAVLVVLDEAQRKHDGDDVERRDAQQALPEVGASTRRFPSVGRPRDPGAGQEEARQHEEDGHTDVQPGQEGAPRPVPVVVARPEGGVRRQDAEGADRAQRVEDREVRPRLGWGRHQGRSGLRQTFGHHAPPAVTGPTSIWSTHRGVPACSPPSVT